MKVALLETPLDPEAVLAEVRHQGFGAIDLFLGLVRDTSDGQTVTALEYHSYPEMALRELSRLTAKVEADFTEVRVAVHHRLGVLQVGELAVICAAGAAHRDQAFLACRALIEAVKVEVPIWKRELIAGGQRWVGWPLR